MPIERTPWGDWLRAAAALGITPEQFWRLAVADWRALMGRAAREMLTLPEFHALSARFPDERT